MSGFGRVIKVDFELSIDFVIEEKAWVATSRVTGLKGVGQTPDEAVNSFKENLLKPRETSPVIGFAKVQPAQTIQQIKEEIANEVEEEVKPIKRRGRPKKDKESITHERDTKTNLEEGGESAA